VDPKTGTVSAQTEWDAGRRGYSQAHYLTFRNPLGEARYMYGVWQNVDEKGNHKYGVQPHGYSLWHHSKLYHKPDWHSPCNVDLSGTWHAYEETWGATPCKISYDFRLAHIPEEKLFVGGGEMPAQALWTYPIPFKIRCKVDGATRTGDLRIEWKGHGENNFKLSLVYTTIGVGNETVRGRMLYGKDERGWFRAVSADFRTIQRAKSAPKETMERD